MRISLFMMAEAHSFSKFWIGQSVSQSSGELDAIKDHRCSRYRLGTIYRRRPLPG